MRVTMKEWWELQFETDEMKRCLDTMTHLKSGEYTISKYDAKSIMSCSDIDSGRVSKKGNSIKVYISDDESESCIVEISDYKEYQKLEFVEETCDGSNEKIVYYKDGKKFPVWLNNRIEKEK